MIKGKIDKNKTIKKQCECERQKKNYIAPHGVSFARNKHMVRISVRRREHGVKTERLDKRKTVP